MAEERLQPELERRLRLLEDPRNQGEDFDGVAWAALIGLGVLLPILALLIGRMA
ncbi:hypothetical protein [Shinella zoogloeoides]|uniref:hypothetical protein n=1 Tax=Shinella zoogloeoides TaxID=352475 RepID=UPI0013C2B086|nr:hypothetical protein [Shinella zoogloeoides]